MNDRPEIGSFFSSLAKVATAAVSPVLAADKLLRKVPGYTAVSKLAPAYAQREKALNAAHSIVKRAEKGDVNAKQAIGAAVNAAAKGDPRARAAVHALTIARQVSKGTISADCLRAGSKVATAGELAIVGATSPISAADIAWAKSKLPRAQAMVADLQRARKVVAAVFDQCTFDEEKADLDAQLRSIDATIARVHAYAALLQQCLARLHPVVTRAAGMGALPHLNSIECVTAGCGSCFGPMTREQLQQRLAAYKAGYARGQWLSTAGGDVFVPAAYESTAGARAARGQRLLMQPRTARQLQAAAHKERAGRLPLGTTRRWAERAVSGFESAHGGAQTLREWLGQDPSLNLALK